MIYRAFVIILRTIQRIGKMMNIISTPN